MKQNESNSVTRAKKLMTEDRRWLLWCAHHEMIITGTHKRETLRYCQHISWTNRSQRKKRLNESREAGTSERVTSESSVATAAPSADLVARFLTCWAPPVSALKHFNATRSWPSNLQTTCQPVPNSRRSNTSVPTNHRCPNPCAITPATASPLQERLSNPRQASSSPEQRLPWSRMLPFWLWGAFQRTMLSSVVCGHEPRSFLCLLPNSTQLLWTRGKRHSGDGLQYSTDCGFNNGPSRPVSLFCKGHYRQRCEHSTGRWATSWRRRASFQDFAWGKGEGRGGGGGGGGGARGMAV